MYGDSPVFGIYVNEVIWFDSFDEFYFFFILCKVKLVYREISGVCVSGSPLLQELGFAQWMISMAPLPTQLVRP